MNASRTNRLSKNSTINPPSVPDRRSILGSLARVLLGMGGGNDMPPWDGDENADRWEEDSGYYYIEASIPGMPKGEMDITVHNGRAFIRIEK